MRRPLLSFAVATAMAAALLNAGPAAATASPLPRVSSVSSSSGALTGGARVSLHGSGLAHVDAVYFGGAKAHVVRATSSHVLTVVVPHHKAGRVDIRVLTTTGESPIVKADRFTYVTGPTLTSVTPDTGPTAGGTRVTVRGKNFRHVTAVLFGQNRGTTVHVVSATSLLVTAPAHGPSLVDVHITTAYGTSKTTGADHFTYPATTLAGQPISPPPTPTPTPSPTPPPPPILPLVITTGSLPSVLVGNTYPTTTLAASGGRPPYTWSATGLPNGLTVGADGGLTGSTYAPAAIRQITLRVTDAVGTTATATLPLTVTPVAGQLFAWGYDTFSNVGDGGITSGPHAEDTSRPIAVPGLTSVIAAVGDNRDGFAATSGGTVWEWGDDTYGELGDGRTTLESKPIEVSGVTGVVALAVGELTTYALTSLGTVYSWGSGAQGQLGDGQSVASSGPVQVSNLTDIVGISAAAHSAFAVRSDGTVLAWGSDGEGELGDGATTGETSPIPVPGLTGVVAVAAGGNATYALHADGTVSGWGTGLLGTASTLPVTLPSLTHVVQIAAGGAATYALRTDGTILAWGDGEAGALGDGTRTSSSTPVQVSGITDAESVAGGGWGGFAIVAGGGIRAWGGNGWGGVGDGTRIDRITPVSLVSINRYVSIGQDNTTSYAVEQSRTIVLGPPPPKT